MAGETANIMAIAEKESESLLSRFGWSLTGPSNENFPCEKIPQHKKEKSPTHPCDVVFRYDDPYEARWNYFLTDVKSYKAGSMDKTKLKGALRELAKAVDCANVSTKWRSRYVNDAHDWRVHGLLFVYNHDNEFDKDFLPMLRDDGAKRLELPRFCKLFVIGPPKIRYFLTIINDLKGLSADSKFPLFKEIPFLYPDRIRRFAKQSTHKVGRIELLLGPWQVVPYDFEPQSEDTATRAPRQTGFYIYYEGPGKVSSEFEFLFDFCFRNQLVKDGSGINIRMPNADGIAPQKFLDARENFARNFYSSPDIKKRLDQFSMTPVQVVVKNFCTEHVGMERRVYG